MITVFDYDITAKEQKELFNDVSTLDEYMEDMRVYCESQGISDDKEKQAVELPYLYSLFYARQDKENARKFYQMMDDKAQFNATLADVFLTPEDEQEYTAWMDFMSSNE